MWGTFLSEPLRIVALVGRYPANWLMRRMPSPHRIAPLANRGCPRLALCGIRRDFSRLSPCGGQVAYVLLTRAPVAAGGVATTALPLDLHVLSLSLAFILSQDQTLRWCLSFLLSFSLLKDRQTHVLLFVACVFHPSFPKETSASDARCHRAASGALCALTLSGKSSC